MISTKSLVQTIKGLLIVLCCWPVGVWAQAPVGGAGAGNGFVLDSGGVVIDTIRDEDTMSSNDANALATQQSIKAYVDNRRWRAESTFSRTDDDTMSITVADCTNYQVGTPIRYSADNATWYYAIVTACTDAGSTITVDLDGAPFTTARDDYLSYGSQDALHTVQLVGVGNASVSDTWFPKYLWGGADAYFVRIYVKVDTAPTGATLTGNVELNGTNALDTEFSIAASGTSTDSGTTLDDSTYANTLIEQDEFVEIDISQIGSTVPGGNAAWAKLYFIIP